MDAQSNVDQIDAARDAGHAERSTFGRIGPTDTTSMRGLGRVPAPEITAEMLRERETFNLKEHLAGRPPSTAPAIGTEQNPIAISKDQVIALAKHYGLTVIDAEESHGGILAQHEQRIEVLTEQLRQSAGALDLSIHAHSEALTAKEELTKQLADSQADAADAKAALMVARQEVAELAKQLMEATAQKPEEPVVSVPDPSTSEPAA